MMTSDMFGWSGSQFYVIHNGRQLPIDPIEELTQMCGQIERLKRELSDMAADCDNESRWAGAYLEKLLRCQKLLREATSNPERVTEGEVRCWEVLLTDEWMDEARKMGGE